MVLDDQEVRQRLEALAAGVGAPRLTAGGLIGQIRRRRLKMISLFSASIIAVVAVAVTVPVALAGGDRDSAVPEVVTILPSFTVTVNDQSQVRPKNGPPPSYRVRPGERLSMRVAVTVPRHLRITKLWLGISRGTWGNGPKGPIGMRPILVSSRQPLPPGLHTFALDWRVPRHQSGDRLYLITVWSAHNPPVSDAQAIAILAH